jgi:hypothetical protein
VTEIISFIHENIFIIIALIALILLCFYNRPKVFLTIFLFVFIIASTIYLIFNISNIAVENKRDLINQTASKVPLENAGQ